MRVKIVPFGMNNYLVSDDGRVFNGFTGKELKQTIGSRTGYSKVVLYGGNGEKKYENIHRLVAKAFVEGTGDEVKLTVLKRIIAPKTLNGVLVMKICDTLM